MNRKYDVSCFTFCTFLLMLAIYPDLGVKSEFHPVNLLLLKKYATTNINETKLCGHLFLCKLFSSGYRNLRPGKGSWPVPTMSVHFFFFHRSSISQLV